MRLRGKAYFTISLYFITYDQICPRYIICVIFLHGLRRSSLRHFGTREGFVCNDVNWGEQIYRNLLGTDRIRISTRMHRMHFVAGNFWGAIEDLSNICARIESCCEEYLGRIRV